MPTCRVQAGANSSIDLVCGATFASVGRLDKPREDREGSISKAAPPATGHQCDQADRPAARPHELLPRYFESFSLGWRPEKTFEISGNAWPLPRPSGLRDKYGPAASKVHSLDGYIFLSSFLIQFW